MKVSLHTGQQSAITSPTVFIRAFITLVLLVGLSACTDSSSSIALGTLERDRIAHTATANEVIVELPIAQGSAVKKGDVLVRFDLSKQNAIFQEAQAHVTEARANLDKLRNGARAEEVAAARAKLEAAKADAVQSQLAFERVQKLINTSSISQAEFDRIESSKNANVAAVHSAEEELLLLTNGTRPEDLQIGEAKLAVAKAVLASETQSLKNLTVEATRDRILDNLPWNEGERVSIGSPVAIVLAGKAPHARVYIPEVHRVKVSMGDSLSIRVDGIEQVITGEVRYISSEPAFTPYYALNQEERSRLMYLAELQLPDSYSNLPNGIPVEVELP